MNRILHLTLLCYFCTPFLSHSQCYNLVWSDEFNGSTLNTSNWSYDVGAGIWGNNELQYYTNGSNVEVSNGTLKIVAKSEVVGTSNYTSGRIVTKNKGDFRYGKFEARAKMPQGQGLWPAFWLLPTNSEYGSWPKSGEIDVLELLGHQPNIVYGTIHSGDPVTAATISSSANYMLPSGTFADDFHTFTLEWTPTSVKWLVDGNLYSTKTVANISPWVFDKAFHILLNVAVGGTWPGAPNGTTVFPQTMEVDYVRIYQKIEDIQIVGAATVEPSSTGAYTVPTIANTTYTWSSAANASISGGQTTPQATVTFSPMESNTILSATLTNSCGTATPQYPVAISANQWSNPDFEKDLTNWNTAAYSGAVATFAITTTDVQHATKAICASVTALGTYPWNAQLSHTAFNVTAGQSYTLTYWAKGDADSRPYNFAFINAANFAYRTGNSRTTTTSWTKQIFTFTPTVSESMIFTLDLGLQTGTYCFDNFVFGKTELVIPVELIDFQAVAKNKTVSIEWNVAQELNLKNYEIQRSQDGLSFETIGFVSPQNKATRKDYAFEDDAPLTNISFYRLKINEQDGTFSYSKVQSVQLGKAAVSIFPNPTHDFIEIKNIESVKTLELLDPNGRLLREFSNTSINRLDLRDFPKGVYHLKIGTTGTFSVVKVVKM